MKHIPDSVVSESTHASAVETIIGHCFGCGQSNPNGLHLHFLLDPVAHTSWAEVHLSRLHEGPPGHIHGGIIATLLDEAMGKLNPAFDVLAMTRNMEVDYLRPSPLYTDLVLTGRNLRQEGRKLFHEAELSTPRGVTLARAKALFIAIDPVLIGSRPPISR